NQHPIHTEGSESEMKERKQLHSSQPSTSQQADNIELAHHDIRKVQHPMKKTSTRSVRRKQGAPNSKALQEIKRLQISTHYCMTLACETSLQNHNKYELLFQHLWELPS
ncbi:hypothetical protein NPIL_437511, partial [Nephila pilipes]